MKTRTLEVTPQLLATAQHVVGYDAGHMPGRGVGAAAASEVFGWDPEGQECLRFGRTLDLKRSSDTRMPLLPEVYFSAVDAQECDPDAISIRTLKAGEVVLAFWDVFFRDQVDAIGQLAVNCLLESRGGDKTPAARHRHARGLGYVASVVNPEISAPGLDATRYDRFDVLAHVRMAGANNLSHRQHIAASLQEAAQRIRSGDVGGADNDELILAVHNLFAAVSAPNAH